MTTRTGGDEHRDEDDPLFISDEWKAEHVRANRMLVQYFPELKDEYERVVVAEEWEEEGPMVVYGFVIYDFLEATLMREPDDSPLLTRIFDFLQMLEDDPNQEETATVGIADFLASNTPILKRALPRLGPKMRAAVEEE